MIKRLGSFIPLLIVILTVLFIYKEFISIDGLILLIIIDGVMLLLTLSFFIHKRADVLCIALYGLLYHIVLTLVWVMSLPDIFNMMLVINTIVLIIYYIIVFNIKPLKESIGYFSKGEADGVTIFLIIGTILISAVALILWFNLLNPDVKDLQEMLPTKDILLLIPIGIAFALFNSLTEELVWRGIFWDGLKISIECPVLLIIIQAVGFGLLHWAGFPRGWVGVGLAGVYGLFLGIIRHRSKGILYPILTHFFADMVIFGIVAYSVLMYD
jgi:hypothetical protein